ncbi:hypothetical protein DFJ73DRAFT_815492 [Zopfochytrium polystomum]|nr:hypothetical protein DFJ73DRAFT_815492 [Zopfochytrium polystomum]
MLSCSRLSMFSLTFAGSSSQIWFIPTPIFEEFLSFMEIARLLVEEEKELYIAILSCPSRSHCPRFWTCTYQFICKRADRHTMGNGVVYDWYTTH